MFGGQLFDTFFKIALTLLLAALLIGFLPVSPFQTMLQNFDTIAGDYLGYINWFFPVGKCLSALTVWATGIGIYYAYAWILRQLSIVSK